MTTFDPTLPEAAAQDLQALTFSRTDTESIRNWVKGLPMANLGSIARSLFQALGEINRLKTTPQLRFEILEALRPAILHTYQGLKKHYLNQPVILPDQARKVAQLSEAIITRAVEGYRLVAAQCQSKMRGFHLSKPTTLMAMACYRALQDSQLNLLRSYQLYQPPAPGLWQNLHLLYQVCETFKLSGMSVGDALGQHKASTRTPTQMYLRACLFGCVKANQLRQEDMQMLDDMIDEWLDLVHLTPVSHSSDQSFIIDPETDNPPIYQKFYKGNYNGRCRHLDTSGLVSFLKTLAEPELTGKQSPLTRNLINHLILAWGALSDRTFMRLEASDNLAICLGLSTTHYFVSAGISFEELIQVDDAEEEARMDAKTTPFGVDRYGNHKSLQQDDPWSAAFDSKSKTSAAHIELESIDYHVRKAGRNLTTGSNDRERYTDFEAMMVNISPGGYCLEWPNEAPAQLRTGEIIGIKEKHHGAWSIGAIRWVRQSDDNKLRLGVELLSPTAAPYGAKVLQARGDNSANYMRVLVLPEIKSIGQPMSMITPALGFKEGNKAQLIQRGKLSTVVLTRQVAATGSYYQFEILQPRKTIDERVKTTEKPQDDSSFDSLWNNL